MLDDGHLRRLALLCASGALAGALVVDDSFGERAVLLPEETAAASRQAGLEGRAEASWLDGRLPGLDYSSIDGTYRRASSPLSTSGYRLRAPNATEAAGQEQPKAGTASIVQIFSLCACMYGGIAMLWTVYWRLPEAHAAREYGKVSLLCATWASMSVGMQVLNNTLVTMLKAPALITIAQMWITAMLVGVPSYRQLLDAPKKQLVTWLIVPISFAAMLCTSCYTYQYISLSFYVVIRNMTPLVVLPIERVVMPADQRPKLSRMVVAAMGVMLAGAVIYAGGIGSVSVIGCLFAFANMLIAVGDRLMQRRLLTTECSGLSSTVCTAMNNAFGSMPALALAIATHQVDDVSTPEGRAAWTDPCVLLLLVLSGAIGAGICYLGFECQRTISATSFFVLQNVSKVAVIVCSITFFQDPIRSPLAVAGLALSIGGSFGYGKAHMALQEQAKQDEKRKLAEQAQAHRSA